VIRVASDLVGSRGGVREPKLGGHLAGNHTLSHMVTQAHGSTFVLIWQVFFAGHSPNTTGIANDVATLPSLGEVAKATS
jgi:hypothetical protein